MNRMYTDYDRLRIELFEMLFPRVLYGGTEEEQNAMFHALCEDGNNLVHDLYATMCVQEDYTLTGAEKYAAEIQALSGITQLGFDNTRYAEEESFAEFFDVSKEEIIEFYKRKALYNKYFLAMSGQTQDIFNDLMSEYQKFTERQKAQEKIQSYWENISVLNSNVSKYFQEHRYEYATNYIEVIFMRYPLDENGRVCEVARILGGLSVTEAQMAAARDMIEEGKAYR